MRKVVFVLDKLSEIQKEGRHTAFSIVNIVLTPKKERKRQENKIIDLFNLQCTCQSPQENISK